MKGKIFTTLGAKISEASPEILVGVGIVSLFAAGVLAAIETQSLDDIIDEQNAKRDDIIENHSEEELEDKEVKHELAMVKLGTVGRVSWHYAPAVGLAALGVTSVLVGHHILKGRYLAAVAGYNVLQQAYDAAMDRVKEKFGDAAYKYAKYGITEEEYTETEVDEETGKKKKVKKTKDVMSDIFPNKSPYMVTFGPETSLYQDCHGDIMHMRSQASVYESGLNETYHAGYPVMFDDILKMFCGADSEERTDERRALGWYKRDNNNRDAGDDCVDLRLFTWIGVDEETGEDKVYLSMDPNVPGMVSFDNAKKYRKGGKYISQM